ncbi:MAG: RDD family protein [Halolamina sp.]
MVPARTSATTSTSGYGPGDTDVVGARIVAQIIDSVVMFVLIAVVAAVVGLLVAGGGGRGAAFLLSIAVFLGYGTVPEGGYGQTVGKMLLSVRVVDKSGSQIGYASAFVRNIPALFGGWLTWLVGVAAIAVDDQNQRLFDQLAETYVVKQ